VRQMNRLLLKPEEVGEVLGIGRTAVYAAMKRGDLESVLISSSRRVPCDAVERYVDRLREQAAT
jgi:excisionase family DNA binding protein